jgi:hypothetical protein
MQDLLLKFETGSKGLAHLLEVLSPYHLMCLMVYLRQQLLLGLRKSALNEDEEMLKMILESLNINNLIYSFRHSQGLLRRDSWGYQYI